MGWGPYSTELCAAVLSRPLCGKPCSPLWHGLFLTPTGEGLIRAKAGNLLGEFSSQGEKTDFQSHSVCTLKPFSSSLLACFLLPLPESVLTYESLFSLSLLLEQLCPTAFLRKARPTCHTPYQLSVVLATALITNVIKHMVGYWLGRCPPLPGRQDLSWNQCLCVSCSLIVNLAPRTIVGPQKIALECLVSLNIRVAVSLC